MSLFAILSAVSIVASQMNASTLELSAQRGRAQQSIAVHDVMNAIEKNASANGCIFSSAACREALASEYGGAFGVGLSFSFGSAQSNQSYANSTEKCNLVAETGTNETEEVCVLAGGG